ncbi:sialidase family protein [Halocatena salina]|uniref:Glycoside hydrolase n=1 Tax=Halocatena salina TaxID=2934340 RepID=A0A8U0A803_9EURY|nr:sialidase family protein [Halocatena salina]UPM44969.1 glycoside hydrolase [Halocatena salina]
MAERIYAALEDVLVVLTTRDGDWDVDTRLTDYQPQCVAVAPEDRDLVFTGTFNNGLWRSTDGGDTWTSIGDQLSSDRVMALAIDTQERPQGYGTVYAGTEPSALFRSVDGGETWTECSGFTDLASKPDWAFPGRPDTHHVRWIESDPIEAGHLYVSIEMGALVTTKDGGKTWTDRVPGSPRDVHTLATHPDAPGRLYAATGDGYITAGREYAESRDGSVTWTYHSDGIEHQYGWGLAVDPGDPDTQLLSASYSPAQAHRVEGKGLHGPSPAHRSDGPLAVIYRRSGQDPWQRCTEGLPAPEGTLIPVLAADESEVGTFYALTNHGLYRSTDAGVTWTQLEIPWQENYRTQHPQSLVIA